MLDASGLLPPLQQPHRSSQHHHPWTPRVALPLCLHVESRPVRRRPLHHIFDRRIGLLFEQVFDSLQMAFERCEMQRRVCALVPRALIFARLFNSALQMPVTILLPQNAEE